MTPANTGLAGVGIDKNTYAWGSPISGSSLQSNTTYTHRKITGPIDLSGKNNVVIDQSWVVGSGGGDLINFNNSSGFVIRDSTIDNHNGIVAFRAGSVNNYLIQRVYSPDAGTIAFWIDGGGNASTGGVIEDTYMSVNNNGGNGSAHCDGFTRRGGTQPLTIRRSRIYDNVPSQTTGAFFLQDSFNEFGGGVGGVHLEDSLLEGAGYPITLSGDQNKGIVSSWFSNVRIRGEGQFYGPVSGYGNIRVVNQWSNMYQYGGSSPLFQGSPISQP